MKRRVSASLRALVGIVLLVVLVWTIGPMSLLDALRGLDIYYLLLAVMAQMAAKLIWTFRWQEILRVSGLRRGFFELLAVLHVGLFFNNFLPTSMGGDLLRGYYSGVSGGRFGTAYGAVIAERLMGFLTLAALCAAAILALLSGENAGLFPRQFLLLGLVGCMSVLVAGMATLYSGSWSRLLIRLMRKHESARSIAAEISSAIQFAKQPGSRMWFVLGTSMILQIVAVFFYIASSRAVGISLEAVSFFFVVPLAVVASMLPVSLNGLGLREGALVGLLYTFGVPASAAAAFAVLARLIDMLFAALGGVVFVACRMPSRTVEEGK